MPLDAIDRRIIAELQADGSLANVELARRVHLSPSPCLARVRALERAGVIRRYVALVDPEALERFILDRLSPIPGVEKIRSSFTLKQVRYKTALPMPPT